MRLADGRIELRLKHPWRDGTHALLLEPDDLLVRLVASVPPPRFHLLRYFGVAGGAWRTAASSLEQTRRADVARRSQRSTERVNEFETVGVRV